MSKVRQMSKDRQGSKDKHLTYNLRYHTDSVLGGPGDVLATDSELDGFRGHYAESGMTPSQIRASVNERRTDRHSRESSSNVPAEPELTAARDSGTAGVQQAVRTYPGRALEASAEASEAQSQRESDAKRACACEGACGCGSSSSSSSASSINLRPAVTCRDLALETRRPKFGDYLSVCQRKFSFSNWLKINPTRESLAQAGFFYAGPPDSVCCFHCGVYLKTWEPADDPWVEHALWSPDCPYVLSVKKAAFVSAVKKLNQQTSSSSSTILLRDVEKELESESKNCAALNDDNCTWLETYMEADEEKLRNDEEQFQRENESMLDSRRCKICLEALLGVLFLPCGHLVSCGTCAPALTSCPVCRKDIQATAHVQTD
ncbi:hypothetical protein ACOMHN_043094 [Nucella lapillus]